MNQCWIICIPVVFSAGVAIGGDRGFNHLKIARDGTGHPVLRGSSIAGVIRHALRRECGFDRERLNRLFGQAAGNDDDHFDQASRIVVADARLETGQTVQSNIRTHHLRDRHTKTVMDHGLFTLEGTTPGTTTQIVISLVLDSHEATQEDGNQVITQIAALFASGINFGGNSARGVGRAELKMAPKSCHFDLGDLEQHSQYLDFQRAISGNQLEFDKLGSNWKSHDQLPDNANLLHVRLQLKIPRGQDLLIAAGHQDIPRPYTVKGADGQPYYLIPGSSLRGLFRSYMTKLAAKGGQPIADSHQRRRDYEISKRETDAPTGDNHGRAFLSEADRQRLKRNPQEHATLIKCPIAKLFGSLYQATRIIFSDALIAQADSQMKEQVRKHVAIDRVTGGAAESLLFENNVLVPASENPAPWNVSIQIRQPQLAEVQWLQRTIIALDLGILRVGSSKSAGRLELAQPPQATGPHADLLTQIVPQSQNSSRS
jgi:CRISPR/Cas system CSM-associated protein Csm3 (group 7 of RAMP superfamily)